MSLFDKLLVASLPFVPKGIVRRIARRYVAGETLDDMLMVARRFNKEGYLCAIDVLGEFITTPDQARQAAAQYHEVLEVIHRKGLNANISVKPSQMGLLLDKNLCYEIFRELISLAQEYNTFVRIEMEDSACTSDTIELYLKLRDEFKNCGIVLQAYMRRTMGDARHVISERAGNFRLCKGIYIEPRTVAYKDRKLVNQNYALVLEEMLKSGAYVGIATHDERLVWEAQRLIDQYKLSPDQYEFQMLLGVDPELREIIRNGGHRVRVYIPFGKQWYAYSTRRLRENPKVARYVFNNMIHSIVARLTGKSAERRAE